MGKSSKKSATKVDVAPVAVTQSGKKGKRGAENEIEKAVSAKKQKVQRDEAVIAKQKVEKKQVKKKAESSSDEESESDSDSEAKVVSKKVPAPAKNGSVVAKKSKDSSSDSSESDSDDSDAKPAVKKPAVKNSTVAVKKTAAAESSESDSDEDVKPAAVLKNGASKAASSSSDDDSSDEEEEKKVAAQPKKAVKKAAESSDDDSDDSSSEEETVAKVAPAATKAKVESSDDDSDESSDDDEEPKASKPKVQAAMKSDSSSSEEDSDEEENEKTPKKKDTDVKMVDAKKSALQKTPKAPATPEATGSKTLFVGNLSFSVEESDVREFFKEAGEVVDIRFATNPEGQFKGFGHVEFATAEAAQKALELHDQPLCDRPVRLDLARERGAFTPQSRDNNSFQQGGRAQGQTVFVRGFDTSLGEDEIRSALQKHFASCGEINRTSIPPDHETGGVKGMAYMDFADSDGFNTALGLDGSDLDGCYLTVQEAKPRGDSSGGGRGGRFSGGGGRGGRDGGRGGRFSNGRGGRDGGRGGRFSNGRGGRDGGRGRGGAPYRNTTPSGKKTTFGDD